MSKKFTTLNTLTANFTKGTFHLNSIGINKNYLTKSVIGKPGILAILLVIANLFLGSNSFGQVTTLFLKNTSANPGANPTGTPNVYDLSATQGTSVALASTTGGNSTTFVETFAFTITNSSLPATISGNQFNVSLNVNVTSSANMNYRYRLQRVNSSGAVQASTGYSSTVLGFTTGAPVITTATLSFAPAQTWASTDRLRLSIEDNNTSSGTTRTMTVNVNNASSFVQYCTNPTAFDVTGGGGYCTGGTGVAVGLSNSQAGVNYQLQLGGINTGSPVAGTGAAISFGLKTTVGTYTVVATSVIGGCTSNMTGSVTVAINTPPAAPTVTSPVSLCLNSTASPLTASGSGLLWYTGPSGGTGSPTAPTPSTTSLGSTTYYVSQTAGCEGPRAAIVVNVIAIPVASVTGQSNISCFAVHDGSITILGSPAGTYSYSVNNGVDWTPASPVLPNPYTYGGLAANTPYRIKVKDSNGCISK